MCERNVSADAVLGSGASRDSPVYERAAASVREAGGARSELRAACASARTPARSRIGRGAEPIDQAAKGSRSWLPGGGKICSGA